MPPTPIFPEQLAQFANVNALEQLAFFTLVAHAPKRPSFFEVTLPDEHPLVQKMLQARTAYFAERDAPAPSMDVIARAKLQDAYEVAYEHVDELRDIIADRLWRLQWAEEMIQQHHHNVASRVPQAKAVAERETSPAMKLTENAGKA